MAICWERIRLFRQLFTALISNAVLVVLVPLQFGVWGGIWNSPVLAPDHCLFVHFSVNPSSGPSPAFEKWSGHWTPIAFLECRRHETGRAREGIFPSCNQGLPREEFGFRKAVDVFLLHLECNFGL